MTDNPETARRIAQLEKNVEEIRDVLRDNYYDRKDDYLNRVVSVLDKDERCVHIWLEIDGVKTINEIREHLITKGHTLPVTSYWRSYMKLEKNGLIKVIHMRGGSKVYDKKLWAKILSIDDYVRERYHQ